MSDRTKILFDQLVLFLQTQRKNKETQKLTIQQTLDVLVQLIKHAEHFPELTGSQKKELVLEVLNLLFHMFGGDPTVGEFVYHTASFTIDQIVAVYNAGADFMKSPTKWQKFKARCCCCW